MLVSLWRKFTDRHSQFTENARRVTCIRSCYHPELECLEGRVLLSTLLVTTTDDAGPGSLRQAILDADTGVGRDTIAFNIGGGGVQTIHPASALPTITRPVMIDGTTQPGYAGSPLIELDGSLASGGSSTDGLTITAGNSTVRGLVIHGFVRGESAGIRLENNGGNLIAGNYLGTDSTGKNPVRNRYGLMIGPGSANNVIGGSTADARNLISGNLYGVYIRSEGNVVQGNFIGTDITGTRVVPNDDGVDIVAGSNNTIGGTTAGTRNLVSGNTTGIFMEQTGNLVEGNFIGTDVSGTAVLGNGTGVSVAGSSNTVGGTATGAANLISGNSSHGVDIYGSANRVVANWIGTDVTGTVPLANGLGVYVSGKSNIIGGAATGEGNVISGNLMDGVFLSGTFSTGNQVLGNLIGTNAAGSSLGNNGNGVLLSNGASRNSVGGLSGGGSNTIGFNGQDGIRIDTGPNTFTILGANLIRNQRTDIASGTLRLGVAGGIGSAVTVSAGATLDLNGFLAPGAYASSTYRQVGGISAAGLAIG